MIIVRCRTNFDIINSFVLSSRLEVSGEGDEVTNDGRLFQATAAATANARPPMVEHCTDGTSSRAVAADLKRRRDLDVGDIKRSNIERESVKAVTVKSM